MDDDPRGRARSPVRRRPGALTAEERFTGWDALPAEPSDLAASLWAVLVVATVLDLATTVYALERLGAAEGNPFVRTLLDHAGYVGFAGVKLAVLALGAALWRVLPDGQRLAVPLGLALPTVVAVLVNATVLL